jgi:mono/diheme cytochrome c family protein
MPRFVMYAGRVLAVIAALVALAVVLVYAGSERMLRHQYLAPSHAPFVAPGGSDSALIARGEHMAGAIGKCVDCHGRDFAGNIFIDNAAFGRFAGQNLTRGAGGVGATLTDADYELAVRHGIGPGGRGLLFMPARNYNRMSDEDLGALIAYIKQLRPVDRAMPASHIGPVGRALLLTGKAPLVDAAVLDQSAPHVAAPPVGPTPEYGMYLARVGSCLGCHRSNLEGGPVAGAPRSFKPAANLTPVGIGTWTKADFVRVLRQGIGPGGVPIDSFMPVRLTKEMSDTEIDALWAYLQTVPPQPMGK